MKPKNSDIPFQKTPVGNCLTIIMHFLAACVVGIGCISITVVSLIFVWIVIWMPMENNLFIKRNTPLVQEAIIEQCDLANYEVAGNFNTSSLDSYSDFYVPLQLRIDCHQDGYPDGNWECTCDERESD